jgi:hypothetical protein
MKILFMRVILTMISIVWLAIFTEIPGERQQPVLLQTFMEGFTELVAGCNIAEPVILPTDISNAEFDGEHIF